MGVLRLRTSRLILTYLSALGLALGPVSATHGDEGHRLVIVDTFSEGVSSSSEIHALPDEQVQKIIRNEESNYLSLRKFCESLDSAECREPAGLSLRVLLPMCSTSVVNYCIDELAISPGVGAALQPASFIGYTNARTYPANSTRGVPESSTTSRWRVPNILNQAGSDTYAVKVLLDGFLPANSNKLFVFQVSALVEPYSEITNNGQPSSECTSWQSGTTCGVRKDFVDGQSARLSVRLPNTLTGWLHGRLKGASIAVSKYDSNQNTLTVTAENVKVPELNTVFSNAQMDALANPVFFRPNGNQWNSVNAGNTAALEWVKQLAKPLNDKATGEHTTWSFSTIPNNRGNNKCFEDTSQLLGVVMTNALVYSPSAPEFDGAFLNYQVGGLHFASDGKTLTTGTYDLLMRSDAARCLYNFTDAPLSASVTVTNADGGEQRISTAILNERDGWLHLAAYGFTFSSPVLRVKLSGVPKTTKAPTKEKNPQTKKSLVSLKTKNYAMTCVKGKQIKRILAAKPMCPNGWRKK